MNVLALERMDRGDGAGHTLQILVDGRDLAQFARDVELSSAAADDQPELAGSYAGPALWRIEDLAADLLGRQDPIYGEDRRLELLVCASCGEPGCWPLEAQVDVNQERVRWSDFRQPHRPGWAHRGLAFEFDRGQYEVAIARLIRQGWRGPDAA